MIILTLSQNDITCFFKFLWFMKGALFIDALFVLIFDADYEFYKWKIFKVTIMSQRIIYNFFSDDELLRISNKIKEAEKNTSAEIVVVIKEKRKLFENKKAIRELAEDEFIRAGIANTADKTGVLIFILLSEKQFYILADEKISDKIPQQTFDLIANEMSNQFKSGKFSMGIIYCIDKLNELLSRDFPIKLDDIDELSNKIVIN